MIYQTTFRRSFVSAGFCLLLLMVGAWSEPKEQATGGVRSQDQELRAKESERLRREFQTLEHEMEDAYDAYVASVREQMIRRASQESSAEKAESSEPPDGRLAILEKMDAVADAAKSDTANGEIVVRTFLWSAAFRLDPDKLLMRLDRIVPAFVNEPSLPEALEMVPDVFHHAAGPQDWLDRLEKIDAATTNRDVRLVAAFCIGKLRMAAGELDLAKRSFARVIASAKESREDTDAAGFSNSAAAFAKEAGAYVYELEYLQPGMKAPDFSARSLYGEDISLKDYRGRVVLIDFWATWCPQCLAELPNLRAAAVKLADQPFVILTISLDHFRQPIDAAIARYNMPGVHIWDDHDEDYPIARKYNAQALPVSFLIDRKGVIRARNVFGEKLVPAVEALLPRPSQKRMTVTH